MWKMNRSSASGCKLQVGFGGVGRKVHDLGMVSAFCEFKLPELSHGRPGSRQNAKCLHSSPSCCMCRLDGSHYGIKIASNDDVSMEHCCSF